MSGIMRCALALLFSVTCGPAFAAGTVMEAFDLAGCREWRLDDDRGHTAAPPSAEGRSLIAETLRQAGSMQLRTALISGEIRDIQRHPGEQPPPAGTVFCVVAEPMNIERNASYASTLTCFAFVGTGAQRLIYRAGRKDTANWSPATYECAAGCTGYPVAAVYELPWEDGPVNRAHDRASRAFSSRCRK